METLRHHCVPVIHLSSGNRMISDSDLAHRPRGVYNHMDDRDICASFLLAAVTGGHRRGGLNTHLFSYCPGGQKPDVCVTGQKPKCQQGHVPLEALGTDVPWPFQLPELQGSWLMASSSIFRARSVASPSLSLCWSLCGLFLCGVSRSPSALFS